MALSAGSRRHLLLGILLAGIPDTRSDRPARNSSGGTLPSGSRPVTGTVGAAVVCADALMDFERLRNAERTLLGGNARFRTAVLQSVAPGNAGHLLRVLSIIH